MIACSRTAIPRTALQCDVVPNFRISRFILPMCVLFNLCVSASAHSISQSADSTAGPEVSPIPLDFICATPQISSFDRILSPSAKPFFFSYDHSRSISIVPLVGKPAIITQHDFQLALGSDAWQVGQGLPGSTPERILLGVQFLGAASTEQKAWAQEFAQEWTSEHGVPQIHFVFGDVTGHNIRVSFNTKGGNKSEIGNQALNIADASMATMNLGDVKAGIAKEDIRRVVLHEFGHALGLRHEHQHPQSGFVWMANGTGSVVIAEMKELAGWSASTTRKNIIHTYSNSFRCKGAPGFDYKSVMLYPIPSRWLEGDHVTTYNTTLSDADYDCVKALYKVK